MTDIGKKPELAWLPVAALQVDARYQRDTASRRSRNLIERIAREFRWPRFQAILAVKAGKKWTVIDGQHRVEACKLRGDIQHVPAVVLPAASLAEAAGDFVAINRDRVTVTSLHIHHAMLAAGDPVAARIKDICDKAGVEVPRYPVQSHNLKPGQTLAIGTITDLVEHGPTLATRTLTALRQSYPDKSGCIRADYIKAVGAILAGLFGQVPALEAVIAALASRPQREFDRLAIEEAEQSKRTRHGALAVMIFAAINGECPVEPAAARVSAMPPRLQQRVEPARPPKSPAPPAIEKGKSAVEQAAEILRGQGLDVRPAKKAGFWMIGKEQTSGRDLITIATGLKTKGAA